MIPPHLIITEPCEGFRSMDLVEDEEFEGDGLGSPLLESCVSGVLKSSHDKCSKIKQLEVCSKYDLKDTGDMGDPENHPYIPVKGINRKKQSPTMRVLIGNRERLDHRSKLRGTGYPPSIITGRDKEG